MSLVPKSCSHSDSAWVAEFSKFPFHLKQESPPGWTQEAYFPLCLLCCPVLAPGVPHPDLDWGGVPHPDLARGTPYRVPLPHPDLTRGYPVRGYPPRCRRTHTHEKITFPHPVGKNLQKPREGTLEKLSAKNDDHFIRQLSSVAMKLIHLQITVWTKNVGCFILLIIKLQDHCVDPYTY